MRLDCFKWNIGESSAIAQILHVTASLAVKGMKQRILPAIELERFQSDPFAKRLIEYRGRFDPSLADAEIGIGVPDEDVALGALA
jgi:hypothetical protein